MKIPLYALAACTVYLLSGLFIGDLLTVQYRSAAIVTECNVVVGGICWMTPSGPSGIFTFTEFVSAIALLAVVFTISDARYRFRLAIAPLPLFDRTYVITGFIGFAILLTDIWIHERLLVPHSLISQAEWRGMLGGMFLLVVMTWLYYAFIRPPIFSKRNYHRFAQALYRVIVRGNEEDLRIIADELGRSADALITHCRRSRRRPEGKQQAGASDYAHDVLLLIANKKLCRHIVSSAAGTAIAFFNSMTSRRRYDVPLGAFSSNLSAEAIRDKDSLLYHEEEGFQSGLIGYMKPFTLAVYGDYRLVESLGQQHRSPLDIHYEELWSWNAAQLEAFGRATLTTFKAYLEGGHWHEHSFTLYRAFGEFEHAPMRGNSADLTSYYESEAYRRLRATVKFLEAAVDLIGKQSNVPEPFKLRLGEEGRIQDKYDHIAHLMLEVIFHTAALDLDADKSWHVCHNMVWNGFFGFSKQGKAWSIVRHKLRRLIYDEITDRTVGLNFKSARILGFCLYVMGLSAIKRSKQGIHRQEAALSPVLLTWTRKHYTRLVDELPDVAKSVLIGSLSYEATEKRLVKTYLKGLNKEVPKEYLQLD